MAKKKTDVFCGGCLQAEYTIAPLKKLPPLDDRIRYECPNCGLYIDYAPDVKPSYVLTKNEVTETIRTMREKVTQLIHKWAKYL